ncbi:MAG TPA: bis(5'-nucleosyl)-tetraphosphatase (symmetrical) YqeK [Candidatus Acidoferrales bacterium]|nr:bis(5'-nucleosyl)-tetraphosphatase (symmetrical) YqeK [Candidatus Acidoferrales bacterium]
MTYPELSRRVRSQLGQDHRFAHTVRVARCAEILAQRHGLDAAKARLAGMLHDLARLYSDDRLLRESAARGLPIGAFERAHPVLLHAPLSAAIAREAFGVHDPEVLSAIEKHTAASTDMSPLDCAVYLADSLEPGRTHPERAGQWELAQRSLDGAMRAVLRSSFAYLAHKGIEPAPQTVAAARVFGVQEEEVRLSAS